MEKIVEENNTAFTSPTTGPEEPIIQQKKDLSEFYEIESSITTPEKSIDDYPTPEKSIDELEDYPYNKYEDSNISNLVVNEKKEVSKVKLKSLIFYDTKQDRQSLNKTCDLDYEIFKDLDNKTTVDIDMRKKKSHIRDGI